MKLFQGIFFGTPCTGCLKKTSFSGLIQIGPSNQWADFKVSQNRWSIWNCVGSTNCHLCSLVSGMPHLRIVFFLQRILPRPSQNSLFQVHFKSIFFWAHFKFWSPFWLQGNFKYPTDFDQLICIAFDFAQLIWWPNLKKYSFFEAPCSKKKQTPATREY